METQREVVEDKWLDAYDAWQAYHNAVAAYNSHPHVSPGERLNVPGLDKLVATSLYSCAGPCDAIFETASLAQVSHQAYCSEKHGSSGTTSVTYYTCYGNTTCDRSDEHWRLCGGTCGNKYAPRHINRGQGNYDYVANSPHYQTCSVSGCGEAYYTCEHSSCPKSNTHGGSQPPPPSTDNTPNCQDCTSHCSSPCSCTNSGTCNGTVTTPPPPKPEPPTVICGGAAWTNCNSSGITSSTTHYVQSCTQCFSAYWTCSKWAYQHTSGEKTCRRCDVKFYECQNGPCSSGYAYHWAK